MIDAIDATRLVRWGVHVQTANLSVCLRKLGDESPSFEYHDLAAALLVTIAQINIAASLASRRYKMPGRGQEESINSQSHLLLLQSSRPQNDKSN